MAKVEVLTTFIVEATKTRYEKGWKGEVDKVLADRHGPNGTGYLKVITTRRRSTN